MTPFFPTKNLAMANRKQLFPKKHFCKLRISFFKKLDNLIIKIYE